MSRICHFPECEAYCEGTTDYCASHNHEQRKAAKELSRPAKERKQVKKVSEKRKGENSIYFQQVRTWLIGKRCVCCGDPATQCHHAAGRTNDLLLEKKYWKPVCAPCHRLITEDSAWAIANNYSISRNKKDQTNGNQPGL